MLPHCMYRFLSSAPHASVLGVRGKYEPARLGNDTDIAYFNMYQCQNRKVPKRIDLESILSEVKRP
jgi:hypothetical protein